VIEVVCALVEDGRGRVLACCRGPGRALAGQWEFPGGKVEPQEDAQLALVREIREELGCSVHLVEPLTPVEHHYPEVHIRLLPWRAALLDGSVPEAREHAELRWVGAVDGEGLAWAPADVPVWREWCSRQARHGC
jgi:8-oxo-dGTP diphosphatase